jgi:hypothetical protein
MELAARVANVVAVGIAVWFEDIARLENLR